MSYQSNLQYKQVCELSGIIEEARVAGNLDAVAASLELLRAMCALHKIQGAPDHHELEALADYTPNAEEAIAAYRRPISVCDRRQEPTYTKRILDGCKVGRTWPIHRSSHGADRWASGGGAFAR
jgi:hypothetical protein